jgi:hypothetical protein
MTSEEYRQWTQFCKNHKGKIVLSGDNNDERLFLSTHQYPQDHETVVEAGLWEDDDLNYSEYKTFIRRGLDGMDGGTSVVNDGGYAETREEAIEWLEEKAKEYDGSPLNWEERDVIEYETS